ncbi:DUF5675 family protein [Cognataquiflexum rubidum]|uniref:DUF5675 family protein n=1 Tax=Cognataquiflexum rubidum TaxID=2922273 RepID=UPI001F13BCC5|nr:DUF5675 family protein [Cognataquiflexum rubidum]MCH6233741.1 DUF5675 family protein [Cognataquiflexum rubidum]
MKLLLKREYSKHLTKGSLSLEGKLLCKTLEPSVKSKPNPCAEALYRLAYDYDDDRGWYLYFEADARRIEIRNNSVTAAKDCIVPVTCFKKGIPMFSRLACRKLTDKLMDYMEQGEEVWLEIYSEFKPSKQNPWKLNPQNTLQGQEA